MTVTVTVTVIETMSESDAEVAPLKQPELEETELEETRSVPASDFYILNQVHAAFRDGNARYPEMKPLQVTTHNVAARVRDGFTFRATHKAEQKKRKSLEARLDTAREKRTEYRIERNHLSRQQQSNETKHAAQISRYEATLRNLEALLAETQTSEFKSKSESIHHFRDEGPQGQTTVLH